MSEHEFRKARGTACIRFGGRSFVLPASDPYDLDVVLEHSRYLAARHGGAEIQIGGQSWHIAAAA